MKYILIINGMPRTGKDSFVDILSDMVDIPLFKRSWVDIIKETIDWDGNKSPENRKLLADMADREEEMCYSDVINKGLQYITENEDMIYCIFARRPKNIQRLMDYFNFLPDTKVKTILIRRPDVEMNEQSNTADSEVFEYWYMHQIYNDGGINWMFDYKKKVRAFYEENLKK